MDDRCQRLIAKADNALAQSNLTSAMLALNKIRRQFPDSPELKIRDARIALLQNEILTGTSILTQLSQRSDLTSDTLDALIAALQQFELHFSLKQIIARIADAQPDNLAVHIHLGQLLLQTGEVKEAISVLTRCATIAPDEAEIQLQLGHANKALSDTRNAAEAYHRYIELEPQFAGTGYWSLADLKAYRFSDEDIQSMDDVTLSSVYQTALLTFARQRVAEQQGSEDAVALLQQANQLMSGLRPFNQEGFLRLATDVRADIPALPESEQTPQPVFIVGLPRSGTTLTEQILAAHSEVATTDELPFMERIAMYLAKKGFYPKTLHALPEDERQRCRAFYLQQAGHYPLGQASRFIDKNPNNFVHIGLIHTLFPEAKIVCLSRPVMDNLASLYRQMFSKGNDYAFQPEHLTSYTNAFYDLMHFWRTRLPGAVNIVDYEQLVGDTNATISQLLDTCGLTFEAQCLRFYDMDSPVLTPSASQVRQPVNNKSLGSGERYRSLFAACAISPEALESKRQALLKQSG